MWRRCTSPKEKAFKNYGGRGISVCDRWKSFDAFVADMGERPPKFTIERINNDLGYFPENCKWASRAEQLLNRRNTLKVTIEGVTYLAHHLAKECGHKSLTIRDRVERGLSLRDVVYSGKHTSAVVGPAIAVRVARQRAKTHCKHGHEFTPENTVLSKSGTRACRECGRINLRKSRAKARADREP